MSGATNRLPYTPSSSTSRLQSFRKISGADPRSSTSSPVPRIPPPRGVNGVNQQPSIPAASSSRMPGPRVSSLREMSGLHQALLNKAMMHSKKAYVPNLTHSRNIQPNVTIEEHPPTVLVKPKKEPENKDNRKGRQERKLLGGVETFAPETKPQIIGTKLGVKCETTADRNFMKKVFSEELPKKFEGISTSSPQDLPVSVPKSRFIPVTDGSKKVDPLLTHLMRSDRSLSPLYLLRLPRCLPAVIDDSQSQSKSSAPGIKKGCTIQDLLEGQIGKLQVLKSGRLRLVLGECTFWLHKGVTVNFLEELAAVKLDTESKTGNIATLGKIDGRIMVVPDIMTNLKYL